jgi:hypothetical protein
MRELAFFDRLSGIAAEIDTKNMPLAYFLNVSTPACFFNVSPLSDLAALSHLSLRERQGVLARYIK